MKVEIPDHVPAELVVSFDYTVDPSYDKDPFAKLHEAVKSFPRVFFSAGKVLAWNVTRFEDVRYVLQSPELFTSNGIVTNAHGGEGGDDMMGLQLIPVEIDPPLHGKYRALLNPVFSPAAVDKLEADIREYSISLIEEMMAKGSGDFMADFARKLPQAIFVRMMGLPETRLDEFLEWTYEMGHSGDPERESIAAMRILSFLAEHVEERMNLPESPELVSRIIHQKIDGEQLNQMEVLGFCFLLFLAGLDTVTNALGSAFHYLACNPKERKRLAENPDLIANAMEETLRAFPVIITQRFAAQDVELHGAPIKKGDRVMVMLPLANRDASKFPDPALVDLERDANQHLSFGAGPHRCMGSHLARREIRIALEEALQRMPDFKLQKDADVRYQHSGAFGPSNLPMVYRPN